MRSGALAWLAAGAIGAGAAGLGHAQTSPNPAASPLDAKALLGRLQAAARSRNYEGTLVYSAGEVVSSSRVAHFGVAGHWFERIEALDGREQRIYRHNELVHSFWPRSKVVTVEQRDAGTAGTLMVQVESRLAEHYEPQILGRDRVAGRQAEVLLLRARDALRFSQRLWADQATGLMLRADVVGPEGKLLESSAFSQLQLDGRLQKEAVLAPMHKVAGYRVVNVSPVPTRLEDEGWRLAQPPAGFKLLGSVRRMIDPLGGADESSPALHAVFSDGLARVSIFIEPLPAGRQRQPLQTQLGATHTLMRAHGTPSGAAYWVTLMGDVPAATLRAFADGLQRQP
jgi:sigma-E factor negative regulatory protein RseB